MDETEIIRRISLLVEEEHQLRQKRGMDSSTVSARRVQDIEVLLDQCWDLLRQRRARKHASVPPGMASPRRASIVEGYLQ